MALSKGLRTVESARTDAATMAWGPEVRVHQGHVLPVAWCTLCTHPSTPDGYAKARAKFIREYRRA